MTPQFLNSDQLKKITHLLIDLDGTLLGAHDWPLRLEFTAKALSELRKKTSSWMHALKAMKAMYQELEVPSKTLTNGQRAVKIFSEQMNITLGEADAILNDAIALLFPKMEKYFFPIESAKEFLKWAENRYTLILATNPVWKEDIVKLRMRWAGIDPDLFVSITHCDRMHACKPRDEYYLEILEQEKLTQESCFLIGNDPKKDLPATRVGIPVFILGSTKTKSLEPLHPQDGESTPAAKGTFGQLRTYIEANS